MAVFHAVARPGGWSRYGFRALATAMSAATLLAAGAVFAQQQYPAKPIRFIVPQAPGSASDNIARVLAAEMTKQMGQQVVIDNRPGGAFMIGLELAARSLPDGYTIAYGPVGGLAISPNLVKAPIDVVKDLQPVGQVLTGNMLLAASPASPFKSIREVVDFARQNPGKLSNASSGNGSPGHVGFELFKVLSNTQIVHIPYKGGAQAITDLIGGQVQLMMESMNSIAPHARSGRVRPLGVSGPKRSPVLPDVPTIAEAGVPGYEATTWTGVVAPPGVPRPIIQRLNTEINKALQSPAMKEKLEFVGNEAAGSTPEQFGEFVRRELAKWGDVVRKTGTRIE